MKQNFKVLALIFFFISITLWACRKDEISRSDDKEICEYVENQKFEETIKPMNNHLQKFRKNDDKALEKFERWLNSISCVKKAIIICNSCMFSNPPQSSMQVIFESNGQDIEMIMHILMDEKLKVLRIYEP